MAGSRDERSVDMLRRRAERAIDEGRGRFVVEPILEAILERAGEDDPTREFAHRHLAELLLERDPWSAALHLRHVLAQNKADDTAHSLMGLSQALLGNYRAAVASYQRALRLAPNNPWYHHNLGHLLDVALDDPGAALPHLEFALERADATEHEITASAAHCLARLGFLQEAEALADLAVDAAPENEDHRTLLRWVQQGAPRDQPVHPHTGAGVLLPGPTSSPLQETHVVVACPPPPNDVAELFAGQLRGANFSPAQIDCARALWEDYRRERAPRIVKPGVCAAAVHYAIALTLGRRITQTALARRYGVKAGSISARFSDIRATLALDRRDPRYTPAH